MTGFLTGIAVNILAGQIPDLTGADASGSVALATAVDVISDPAGIDLASLAVGASALALLAIAARSRRLAMLGALVALVVPTIVVLATGAGVARVEDAGDIPRGFPLPALPDLGLLSPGLIAGALLVTAIVLVQGTGVSEGAPTPAAGVPMPTETSSPRAPATSPPASTRGCPWAAPWARRH
jgi:SulP family sulfate permease